MAEKYLGEQGLAKLIELVKANSGGGALTVKENTRWFKYSIIPKVNTKYMVTFKISGHNILTYLSVDSEGIYYSTDRTIFDPQENSLNVINCFPVVKHYMGALDNISVGISVYSIGKGGEGKNYDPTNIKVEQL